VLLLQFRPLSATLLARYLLTCEICCRRDKIYAAKPLSRQRHYRSEFARGCRYIAQIDHRGETCRSVQLEGVLATTHASPCHLGGRIRVDNEVQPISGSDSINSISVYARSSTTRGYMNGSDAPPASM